MAFENPSGRFLQSKVTQGTLGSAVESKASVDAALPSGLQIVGKGIGSLGLP